MAEQTLNLVSAVQAAAIVRAMPSQIIAAARALRIPPVTVNGAPMFRESDLVLIRNHLERKQK